MTSRNSNTPAKPDSNPASAQEVPDGWKLVPIEPMPEMIAAFWRQKNTGTQELGSWGDKTSDYDAYRAMIFASPAPSRDAAVPASGGVEAGGMRPEDQAEAFIQAAVDSAPEPLRRLGEWLANVLDEDNWKTAERMLLGAALSSAPATPSPASAEALPAGVDAKAQGFVDGYEAALRSVEVFRIKVCEPFDSQFEQCKDFVRDMLKRNAEKLRASVSASAPAPEERADG